MNPRLTTFHLKLIALLTMTIDHIGYYLIPVSDPNYVWFRFIGRIAFVLFAFLSAEAMAHTRHPWRYVATLAVFGVVFDVVVYLVTGDQIGNIFLTLALGAFAIRLVQYKKWWSLAAILPLTLALWGRYVGINFYYDYGIYGTAVMMVFYLTRPNRVNAILAFFILTIASVMYSMSNYGFQANAVIAVPFIALYSGQPGFRHPLWKWFNYVYYPAHILVLYGLSLWL